MWARSDYLALYTGQDVAYTDDDFAKGRPLNHIGVEVDDLDAVEAKAVAAGLIPSTTATTNRPQVLPAGPGRDRGRGGELSVKGNWRGKTPFPLVGRRAVAKLRRRGRREPQGPARRATPRRCRSRPVRLLVDGPISPTASRVVFFPDKRGRCRQPRRCFQHRLDLATIGKIAGIARVRSTTGWPGVGRDHGVLELAPRQRAARMPQKQSQAPTVPPHRRAALDVDHLASCFSPTAPASPRVTTMIRPGKVISLRGHRRDPGDVRAAVAEAAASPPSSVMQTSAQRSSHPRLSTAGGLRIYCVCAGRPRASTW